jgi:hypothetical protein
MERVPFPIMSRECTVATLDAVYQMLSLGSRRKTLDPLDVEGPTVDHTKGSYASIC